MHRRVHLAAAPLWMRWRFRRDGLSPRRQPFRSTLAFRIRPGRPANLGLDKNPSPFDRFVFHSPPLRTRQCSFLHPRNSLIFEEVSARSCGLVTSNVVFDCLRGMFRHPAVLCFSVCERSEPWSADRRGHFFFTGGAAWKSTGSSGLAVCDGLVAVARAPWGGWKSIHVIFAGTVGRCDVGLSFGMVGLHRCCPRDHLVRMLLRSQTYLGPIRSPEFRSTMCGLGRC